MTEEEQKEFERKKEARKRQLANLKPFKPYKDLTEEELARQKEITLKGGIARGEQAKHNKNMKEQCLTLLNTRLTREQAEKMLGQSTELINENELTVQSVLLMSAVREVVENGNSQFATFLRDTSGQKPKDELTLDASLVTTESDRKLLENVSNRLLIG